MFALDALDCSATFAAIALPHSLPSHCEYFSQMASPQLAYVRFSFSQIYLAYYQNNKVCILRFLSRKRRRIPASKHIEDPFNVDSRRPPKPSKKSHASQKPQPKPVIIVSIPLDAYLAMTFMRRVAADPMMAPAAMRTIGLGPALISPS